MHEGLRDGLAEFDIFEFLDKGGAINSSDLIRHDFPRQVFE